MTTLYTKLSTWLSRWRTKPEPLGTTCRTTSEKSGSRSPTAPLGAEGRTILGTRTTCEQKPSDLESVVNTSRNGSETIANSVAQKTRRLSGQPDGGSLQRRFGVQRGIALLVAGISSNSISSPPAALTAAIGLTPLRLTSITSGAKRRLVWLALLAASRWTDCWRRLRSVRWSARTATVYARNNADNTGIGPRKRAGGRNHLLAELLKSRRRIRSRYGL